MCSLRSQVILVTGNVFPSPQITLPPKRAQSLSALLASLGTPAASLMFPGKKGTCKKSGELFGHFMAGQYWSQQQHRAAGIDFVLQAPTLNWPPLPSSSSKM